MTDTDSETVSTPPHHRYNSIENFANFLKEFKKINDHPRKLEFTGTVKLHGTNASVCNSTKHGFYVQSRNGIVKATGDQFGFYGFSIANKNVFMDLFKQLIENNRKIIPDSVLADDHTIVVYGEWCGGNIQNGKIALVQLGKRFCMFSAKVVNTTGDAIWLDIKGIRSDENDIYNIFDFKTYNFTLDFDNLEEAQEYLTKVTDEVDKECPFAKHFGVSGVGEGIVWINKCGEYYNIFKTKGKSHVGGKKEKVAIENASYDSVAEFVNSVCDDGRIDQAVFEVFRNNPDSECYGKTPSLAYCRQVMTWLGEDVLKENSESMLKSGINAKQMCGVIGKRVAEYMRQKYPTDPKDTGDAVDKN